MDPTAIQSGEPPRTPGDAAPSTWPSSVQVALVVLLTATLFFFLGRWTHSTPIPAEASERNFVALDLNRATKTELRLLPGIGDALAQRIVDQRDRQGGFRCIDDLRQVSGIGPKTLERIRGSLFVNLTESIVTADDSEPTSPAATPRVITKSKKEAALDGLINVNQADQTELQRLPGIGPKLSQRILDERAKARFKSIDELRRVPGIGPKTLEKIRPYVTID